MFTYLISKDKPSRLRNSFHFGGAYVSYSDNTSVSYYSSTFCSTKICIIGYCIDARGEIERKSLPAHLCSAITNSKHDWLAFLKETSRLAGNFVIAVYCSSYFRLVNDSTGCVGIYYNANETACSSSDALLAEHTGAKLSPTAKKIREKATGDGQPLPYDMTDYIGIHISLPNFYFDVLSRSSVRYFPDKSWSHKLSVDECLSRSHNLIKNIVKAYENDYKLICPVTGGWDSRVNYSFLDKNRKLETFTFILPGFTDDTPDISIPKRYVDQKKHKVIKRLEASCDVYHKIKTDTTPYPGNGAVSYAYTLLEKYSEPVFISGDIISHIGSSAIGLDLPNFFAKKSFFKLKLHNFSTEAEQEIDKWIDSIDKNISTVSLFDLFGWESRLGRWAHERNKIMSSMGVISLNIYNCREILELWLAISRKKRKKSNIQGYYLSINSPFLLRIPFNPEDRLGRVKNYKPTYLIASYAKYYFDYLKNNLS